MLEILMGNNILLPFYNWSFFTKRYLYKSHEWNEEKEWRLLSKIKKRQSSSETHTHINKKAIVVYCGVNISVKNNQFLPMI